MTGGTGTGPGYPRRGSRLARNLAGRLLALAGWRVEGELPPLPRFVIIVAPHTTNWDFLIGVLAMFITDLRASWLGKHTIFFFPVAPLLRWIGGEPINRTASHGTVEQAIDRFQSRPAWVLALSPEGTRRRVERWKTGFYRIATGAGVPIVPCSIDYRTRVFGIGAPVWPDQDETAGVTKLRSLFCKEMAKFPDRFAEEARPDGPPAAY